jgi:hypothetical protein
MAEGRETYDSKSDAEKRCEEQRRLPNVTSCVVSRNTKPGEKPWVATTTYVLRT